MHVIDTTNSAAALPKGVHLLINSGLIEKTRAGPCLVAPGPVVTRLKRPWERVVFSKVRDANPFFHVVEAIWMLAGRDDAETLNHYVTDFGQRFAESASGSANWEAGGQIHGAYGHRWRFRFGLDQLGAVVDRLIKDPGTRQCVIQMWDCSSVTLPVSLGNGNVGEQEVGALDLTGEWKDRPCNTHIYLRVRGDGPDHWPDGVVISKGNRVLDMTVCCRSNDIVWGLYGANSVHFSFLQEYLAARVGVAMGDLYILSNNFHMYETMLGVMTKRMVKEESSIVAALHDDRYFSHRFKTRPVFTVGEKADEDVIEFMSWHDECYRTESDVPLRHCENDWFCEVAQPVVRSHRLWRDGQKIRAVAAANEIQSEDWRVACTEWMTRRM